MKFILRILGTWFCGLALVLIIVDGAKTLAANALVMTSLAETWSSLHLASWTQANHTLMTILPEIAGKNLTIHIMSCPSWVIFGILGLLFLLAGRAPTQKRYVATY